MRRMPEHELFGLALGRVGGVVQRGGPPSEFDRGLCRGEPLLPPGLRPGCLTVNDDYPEVVALLLRIWEEEEANRRELMDLLAKADPYPLR